MTLRMTPKRQAILNCLIAHHGTLSAKDIKLKLPSIDLVTIYRSLDLFTTEKLITQVNLVEGDTQYEHQSEPHHHAVCTNCDKVLHFTIDPEKLAKLIPEGFKTEEVELVVKGKCGSPG